MATDIRARMLLTKDGVTPGMAKSARGVKRSAKDMRTSMVGVQGAFAGAKKAAVGFLAVLGVGKIRELVRAQAEMGRFATRIGISTEFLSKMEHAAKSSGIAVSGLRTSLQRLQRRIGEIRDTGKGTALNAITQLGLLDEVKAGAGAEQLFFRIADGLRAIEDPGQRALLTMQMMDTEGVALLQMFDDGAAGLQHFARELSELGGVITREQTAAAEAFEKAWTRASARVGTALQRALTPALKGTSWFLDLLEQGGRAWGRFFSGNPSERDTERSIKDQIAEEKRQASYLQQALYRNTNSPKYNPLDREKTEADLARRRQRIVDLEARYRYARGSVGPGPVPRIIKGDFGVASEPTMQQLGVEKPPAEVLEELTKKDRELREEGERTWHTMVTGAERFGVAIGTGIIPLMDALLDRQKSANDAARDFARTISTMVAVQAFAAAFGGLGGALGRKIAPLFGGVAPEAASGDAFSGPRSGYMVKMHGEEAAVPLSGGRFIPVELRGGSGGTTIVNISAIDSASFQGRWLEALVAERDAVGDVVVNQNQNRAAVREGMRA